jgi:glutathione S-transferase
LPAPLGRVTVEHQQDVVMTIMPLKLYIAPGSCSIAAQIALEESGTEFHVSRVLLSDGEQNGINFRAINPHGRIPVLVADGQVVTELIAILSYIAMCYPNAELLPLDQPLQLAKAYSRMSWYASTLHVAVAQIWRTARYSDDEAALASIRLKGRETLERGFDEIEAAMIGPWVGGDRFSVLDGYTLAFWRWGQRLEIDMNRYPRWAAQHQALMARPAVIRALSTESAAS